MDRPTREPGMTSGDALRGADLHAHTNASDGELAPAALVAAAVAARLAAVAVTDHDTTAGIPEAIEAANGSGMEIVPGVEISCDVPKGTCHVLGFFIDYASPFLVEPLAFLRKRRKERAQEILNRLAKFGMKITLPQRPSDASVGRPHIAKALVDEGHVGSYDEAFQRFLADGRPAYVPSPRLRPDEAFDMILRAGGVPVLAHPHTFDNVEMIRVFAGQGLCGIEAIYGTYPSDAVARWKSVAEKLNLVPTAGSDFHGSSRPNRQLGMVRMEASELERLRMKRRP